MMRELTSLHATMSAANKIGSSRAGRKSSANNGINAGNPSSTSSGAPVILVKQEESPMHQRPGTSTGYESGDIIYYDNAASSHSASNSSFRDRGHSFREPSQSFLVPPVTSITSGTAPSHTQSFLGYPAAQHTVSDSSSRDGTHQPVTSSRPTTSSGLADSQHHPRSLPPLSAVVSATFPSPSQQYQPPSAAGPLSSSQQYQQLQQPAQSILSFPTLLEFHGRPSTANRPGTAPASASFFARATFPDRSGLGSSGRPDLSLLHSGFGGRSSTFGDQHFQHHQLGDPGEFSTSPGSDPSPFFFNPPVNSAIPFTSTSPSSINPRKRAFGGPDGPAEDAPSARNDRPSSSAGLLNEHSYEYGSESRPQSRRLTVMELCNDDNAQPRPASQRREQCPPGSNPLLLSVSGTYGSASRPTTSSGLISSTSTLRIFDRSTPPSSVSAGNQSDALFARPSYTPAGTIGDGTSANSGRGAKNTGRDGGVSFPHVPSASSPATAFPNSTTSTASASPSTPSFAPVGVLSSAGTYPDAAASVVQRGYQQLHEQQHHHTEYTQQQQFYPAQYQLHSPTFSTTSVASDASCSPRSHLSDSPGRGVSPFSPYAHRSSAIYTDRHTSAASAHATSGISSQSHHHRHQQRDAQIRAPVSPHTAGYGMRV